MRLQPYIVMILAALVSLPLVGVALAAAVYIGYSLVTESWYRNTFWTYGAKLLLLYLLFASGIVAAAALAVRYPQPLQQSRRAFLRAAVLGGVVAAGFLEFTFWSDIGDHMAHGLVFLPFVAWALVAFSRPRAA